MEDASQFICTGSHAQSDIPCARAHTLKDLRDLVDGLIEAHGEKTLLRLYGDSHECGSSNAATEVRFRDLGTIASWDSEENVVIFGSFHLNGDCFIIRPGECPL